jgi:glycosyltransferase involved in cell wall biosynthesis
MTTADQDQDTAVMPRAQGQIKTAGRPRRKVFYLLDSLNVGGTETQAVELARRLDPAAYEVTLGCLRARGPLLEKLQGSPVSVAEFYPEGGLDSPRGIYQLLRLAAFLRRGKFAIVHTHDMWSNLMGVPAAYLARVPVIISSQRDLSHFDWYKGRGAWMRRIQNLSAVVLTNADAIRDGLIADDHFAPAKVRVVHNGVDLQSFCRRPELRSQLFPGMEQNQLIVLVGNMHSDVKGHPWLIAAAPAIVREFPEVRFVFAGDGQQRKDLEQQAARLGLERHFLPNAVLEYLAAGLPTVASGVGGNVEIIRDGATGLLVPPEDSDALAAALLRLLRDPGLARRLAEDGHRFVAENFSFERLIADVDCLYTELLQKRGFGA